MSRRRRRNGREGAHQNAPCPCCGRGLYLQEEICDPFPCPFCGSSLSRDALPLASASPEEEGPLLVSEEVFAAQEQPGPKEPACPVPIGLGFDQPCPGCGALLDVVSGLGEFSCPHCGVLLQTAGEEVSCLPLARLSCPVCRGALEFERDSGPERFPCPHCESLLFLQGPDFYRLGGPRLRELLCLCGGRIRLSGIEDVPEPLADAEAALGVGATSVRALLLKGGAPRDLALSSAAYHYRCVRCGLKHE